MLLQDFHTNGDHISDPVAAARHNFPEADIHSMSDRPDSNRSFAAPVSDVSYADFVTVRLRCLNVHSQRFVVALKSSNGEHRIFAALPKNRRNLQQPPLV
jgi:hypothetical protein